MDATRQPYTTVYVKDQLTVQRELLTAVDTNLLPALQAIFETEEWAQQGHPVPRQMIGSLCPRNPLTNKISCAFYCHAAFTNMDRAIEHMQKDHFGLRPFRCAKPNWWVLRHSKE